MSHTIHIEFKSSHAISLPFYYVLYLFRNDYPPAEEATSSEDKGLLVKVITTI